MTPNAQNNNQPDPSNRAVFITIKTPSDSIEHEAASGQFVISNRVEPPKESLPDRLLAPVLSGLITGLLVGLIMFAITSHKDESLQIIQNGWERTQQNNQNIWSISQRANQNRWEISQRQSQLLVQSVNKYTKALTDYEGSVLQLVAIGSEEAEKEKYDGLRASVNYYGEHYLNLLAAKDELVFTMDALKIEHSSKFFDRIFYNIYESNKPDVNTSPFFEVSKSVQEMLATRNVDGKDVRVNLYSQLETINYNTIKNQLGFDLPDAKASQIKDWGKEENGVSPKFSLKAHGGIVHFVSAHDFHIQRIRQELFNEHIKAAFRDHRQQDLKSLRKAVLSFTNPELDVETNTEPSN